jgi:hypothetical protein
MIKLLLQLILHAKFMLIHYGRGFESRSGGFFKLT